MTDAAGAQTGQITSRKDPRFEVTMYKYIGVPDSWTFDFYRSHGGYETARKVLTTMKPAEVTDEVKRSGLRGRGGAGFPTGVKWSFMPPLDGRQRFIVCNADESEPGSFKDRYVMEDDPHQLLEGLILAGYAIGATLGIIYIRGEYYLGYQRLQQAIVDAREAGFLGQKIFGTDVDFDLILHAGAGAYICGEETALMTSFEGFRGQPRLKPPFPATAGIYGLPTTINNVTSIASVVHILEKGAAWFASMGTDDSKGFHHVQLSGGFKKPGVYEVPLGITYREIIYDVGGGPEMEIKAFIPGGTSCPLFPATDEFLDLPMDYSAVAKAGSMLGTGGVILIPKEKCMVNAMYNIVRFYSHESCGKCTPCREGVGWWLPRMYRKLLAGRGEPGDIELIANVAKNATGTAFCALAEACTKPVLTSIKYFREEYEYLIEHGEPRYKKSDWWKDTKDFHELKVWRKAHQVTVDLYRATGSFPETEQGMINQIRRAASTISEGIADGYERQGDAGLAPLAPQAIESLSELTYQLLLAKDLGFLTPEAHARLRQEVAELRGQLEPFAGKQKVVG
jgi:NADH-quinone oxidoreductase subunit F